MATNTFTEALDQKLLANEDITPYLLVNAQEYGDEDAIKLDLRLQNPGLSASHIDHLFNERFNPDDEGSEMRRQIAYIQAKGNLEKFKLERKPIVTEPAREPDLTPYREAFTPLGQKMPEIEIKVADEVNGDFAFKPVIEDNPEMRKAFLDLVVNQSSGKAIDDNLINEAKAMFEGALWANPDTRQTMLKGLYDDIVASVTEKIIAQNKGLVPRGSGIPTTKTKIPDKKGMM